VNRQRLGLCGAVLAAAVVVYLPTLAYDYVQDDRAIIVLNPAAHSPAAAIAAFGQPYWPAPGEAGLYRPVTILSFAIDWAVSHGSPAVMHLENALWNGVVGVLVLLVLVRWLPWPAATAAAVVFVVHPVHVEGVANIVSRNELLASAGMLGGVLLARQRRWALSLCCMLLAMLSKERGVVAGALVLLDDWLRPPEGSRYPLAFYGGIAAVTLGYFTVWRQIGHSAVSDVAPPFLGASTMGRLAMALPASWRATGLLFWPADLSVDYGPQVIPYRTGLSAPALLGAVAVAAIPCCALMLRRRAPAVSFAAGATVAAALPTSNLLFPSGIILAERDLYLPVLLPAAAIGALCAWGAGHWPRSRVTSAVVLVVSLLAARTLVRLPAWRDNRAFLLTLVNDHPESYRGQQAAGAVLSGIGDTAGAHRAYARAESIFAGDPHFNAGYAFFLINQGDSGTAARLASGARQVLPRERVALRVEYLLARLRGQPEHAAALADSALRWFPSEAPWYAQTDNTR